MQVVTIHAVKTTKVEKEEDVNCTSIAQLLKENIGGVVEVQTGNEWFIGRISSLQAEDAQSTTSSGLLILENEKGQIALPLQRITSVRMPSNPSPDLLPPGSNKESIQQLRMITARTVDVDHLQVNYTLRSTATSEAAGEEANMTYITPSIAWLPSYRLLLSSTETTGATTKLTQSSSPPHPTQRTGRLSLKATVINDGDGLFCDEVTIYDGYCAALQSPPTVSNLSCRRSDCHRQSEQ